MDNIKNVIALICMCILMLVGCGKSNDQVIEQKNNLENNSQETEIEKNNLKETDEQQDNKFIGVWTGRKYGQYWACCISSSGKAYIGSVQGSDMSVEEKQIFEYEIDGNTIYLKNNRTNHSFDLKGDTLEEKDGDSFQRANKNISIYTDEDESELLEKINGKVE